MHGRMTIWLILIWLALPLGSAAADADAQSAATPAGSVVVRAKTVVDSDRVLLKHIAQINGYTNAENERIAGMYIGHAPQPGEAQHFSAERIRALLDSYRVKGPCTVPETVTIERGHRVISKASIHDMFMDAMVRQSGKAAGKVKILQLIPNDDIVIPSGKHQISLAFSPGEAFRRRATAKLSIQVNHRHWKSVYITGVVAVFGPAVVVTKDVKRGEVLGMDHVTVKDVDLASQPDNIVMDLGEVLGMEAMTNLKAGQVLTENQVQAPVIVNRGDLVTLVVQMPNMTVTARGIAQQDGRRKQVIKVLNIASNKVVYGQVTSTRTVQVQF